MATQGREKVASGLALPFARLADQVRALLGRRAAKRGDAARDRRAWPAAAAGYAEVLRHQPARGPI